jgi:hypothetical protein
MRWISQIGDQIELKEKILICDILEKAANSPFLHLVFGPPFTPLIPLLVISIRKFY